MFNDIRRHMTYAFIAVAIIFIILFLVFVLGCGGEASGATGDTDEPSWSHVHVVKSERPGGGTVECAVIESERFDNVSVGIDCNW